MRDSRIGTYGALALMLSLAVRVAALAVLAPPVLAGVAAASRAVMVGVLLLLPPARPEGLSASLGRIPSGRAAAAAGLAVLLVALTVPGRVAIPVLLAAIAAWLGVSLAAWRQVGGHTGDVCGAAEQIAECLALSAAAMAAPQ